MMMESFCAPKLKKRRLSSRIIGTRNSLHVTVENGEIDGVETLLSEGVPVDAMDRLDRTALHVAAMSGNDGIFKLLLKNGADIHKLDYQGCTPLHLAAENGHLNIVEIIMNAPSINGKSSDVNCLSSRRRTPLHYAALHGHTKIVEYLLRKGAYNCLDDNDWGTALHVASAAGHSDVVKLLIRSGIDVNIVHAEKKNHGFTPLHCAVLGERWFSGTRNFSPRYRKPIEMNNRQTLKQVEVIDALFEAGAVSGVIPGKFSIPAFYFTLNSNHTLFLKKFIEHGADVNICVEGMTILHHAAQWSSPEFVRLLLDAGADFDKKCENFYGYAPLHLAAQQQNEKICSMLIHAGANRHSKTNQEGSVIGECWRGGKRKTSLMYSLLEYGADINSQDIYGDTLVHFLCHMRYHDEEKNYPEEYAIFFDKFLDFNIQNSRGSTPLKRALVTGSEGRVINHHSEFAIKAMVLMKSSRNLWPSVRNYELMIGYNLMDFYDCCKTELETLKQKKVWGWISFYELLIKPIAKLTEYCMNVELLKNLDSGVCEEFSLYGSLIECRMRIAYKRKILLEKSLKNFDNLIKPSRLPRYVSLQILSYLSLCEIDNLSETKY